jgi:hypothetical protein
VGGETEAGEKFMQRSNFALKMSTEMIKSAIDWGGAALDTAEWAPGPLGALANAGGAVRSFANGNWGTGLMESLNVPLSLVGGNDVTKGLETGGRWLASRIPTFGGKAIGQFGSKAMDVGHGVSDWMKSKPLLNHIPGAFGEGATKSEANWGATNSVFKGPNSIRSNVGKSLNWSGPGSFVRPMVRSTVEGAVGGGHIPFTNIGTSGIGNAQNARAAAGQRAEGAWDQLKNFAGSYGAQPPGQIGPHNEALMATGYSPGYTRY